jgi:hypothetical protein
MNESMRCALVAAALVAIAGCSGGMSPQSASLPSQNSLTFVHRGVPFALPMLHSALKSTTGGYSTKKSLVFEGDQAQAAVNVYQTANLPSNPAPIATIHVANGCPYGMALDKKGTLYVADNCFSGDVEEYPKGSTTLKTTITTPSLSVTGGGMADPFGLALDKKGNLYIADFGASAVFELPAGGTSVTNLNLQSLGEPLGLAIDQKTGTLWETAGSGNVVNIYKLGGSTSPIMTIAGNGDPYAISLENKGKPKGEVVESDLGTYDVYAYMPGAYTPYATLSNGITLPTGLLIAKP